MISIIATSYNQASTLNLLLASLERQTFQNFELVVADDGSQDVTAMLCSQARNFAVKFVTQPDLGYRKSKILNQAIRQTQYEYLIFLDADVILERHFVQDHWDLKKPNHYVCGRRVDLGPKLSQAVGLSDVQRGMFDHLSMSVIVSAVRNDTTDVKRGWRVTLPFLRKFLGYDRPLDILGSNLGIWKSDLISVNGFNEDFESYWGEDGDLFIRLRNSGKISIGAKSICVQYHMFHPRRVPNAESMERYKKLLENREYKIATKGFR